MKTSEKEIICVKEVKGFNGLPYSDYNRNTPNRRDIWLFYVIWNGSVHGFTSCCHLDEKDLPRVEHQNGMPDGIIDCLTNWLLKN